MIPIYLYLVGSSLLGLGFWLGRHSGRAAERNSRERDIDDVVRIRTGYAELTALPVQVGTLAENRRRLELTATPHVPEPVESWPRLWRVLWPALLFVAHFWYTPTGERVDRVAVALWAFLGRRERHWWTDHDHSPHNVLAPTAKPVAAILARLAEEVALYPTFSLPVERETYDRELVRS